MTTDITELAQSLKAAANKAGADDWQAKKISGDFYVIRKGSYSSQCGYCTYQPIAEIDHKSTRDYVAIASPANVLALVEALEKAQHEARVDWEAAASLDVENQELKRRIAELEEAEQKLCAANVTLDARAELAERQLAEMGSRTVTVKLSSERFRYGESDYDDGYVNGWNARMAEDTAALDRVGIKWEAE
ncbi:ead/Ea22-like family protein [Klebsiella grimontii]|uniref:Ead/Ea22-like family protein n=1 Tax=Klebsiella grimontii TaxID=2058152 RepID=A0ABU9P4M2_9ENTR